MSAETNGNPWLYDLRLRDRNLRSGSLDEKELARHLGALVDVESEAETFSLAQPAIGSGELETEEEEVEAAAEAPAVEAPAPVFLPNEPSSSVE